MVRARSGYAWLGAVLGIAGSGALWGDAGVPGGYCRVAGEYGIPCTLLYAIALVESGAGSNGKGMRRPWPWTLNVAGRGHFYPSRRAAWQALNRLIAHGERSIDIGLMQVNWRFHRDRLGNPWQALDPYHNLRVGAGILRDCFRRRHDWWASVGCYHAPSDPARAQRYRARVAGHWRRLGTPG